MITVFKVPPFIATLAMMSIARGLASMITNGSQIIGFPAWFNMGAIIRYGGLVTMTVAVMFVVFALAWLFQRYRQGGRAIYAVGGNPEVARLAGINVNRVTVLVYTACAALVWIWPAFCWRRGLMRSSRPSALPMNWTPSQRSLSAAPAYRAGTGGIGGTIIGVLIIGVLRNGLNLLSVSPFLQAVIIGLVIVMAVAAETFKQRKA